MSSVFNDDTNAKSGKQVIFPLPWGNIAGKIWTNGPGPRVICLHGVTSNSACYDKLIPMLQDRLGGTWCAVDLAGSGRSDPHPPGIKIDFNQFVHDICNVINLLKWKTFHVIAHSASVNLGLHLASFLCDNILSFVSIDMVLAIYVSDQQMFAERYHLSMSKPTVEIQKVFTKEKSLEKIKSARATQLSDISSEIIFQRCSTPVQNGYTLNNDPRLMYSFMYTTITQQMHESIIGLIRCPVLFIEHDEIDYLRNFPSNQRTIDILKRNLGTNMKQVLIKGRHEMLMDNPEPLIDEIVFHFAQKMSNI